MPVEAHEPDHRPSLLRVILGVPAGAAAGLVAALAIMEGIWRGHGAEYLATRSSWTFFVWADHYFWRIAASGAAAFLAGVVAGAVARRNGPLVAILSGTPAMVVWAWLLIAAITGTFLFVPQATPPPDFKPLWDRALPAAASLVLIPICAAQGGRLALEDPDCQRLSELGWHLLYLVPIAVVSILLSSMAAVPMASCIRKLLAIAFSSAPDNLTTLLPPGTLDSWATILLLLPYASAAGLPWIGLEGARNAILDKNPHNRCGRSLRAALGGIAGSAAVMWLTYVVVSWLRQ